MAFKNIDKINSMINELIEENNQINKMKMEMETIETLNEYNEQVGILNKRIDEYNERRRELKAMIGGM